MTYPPGLIFFVQYIFPPIILIAGLYGNAMGFVVLLNKDLINIGPRDTYMYLFLIDTFYLLQIIITNLQYSYHLDLSIVSDFLCKTYSFFNYSMATISPWLIVYITFDRFISIHYPAKRFNLRKPSVQLIWFLFVFAVCQVYYLPVILYQEIIYTNTTLKNQTNEIAIVCNFDNILHGLIISYMDLLLRVLAPFFLMVVLSILLSISLFASRTRIVENFLAEENRTFYKEIRLVVSSICMNLVYMFLQLPVSITVFNSIYYSNFTFYFSFYLFYLSYAINFYIILPTNSLFRKKFFELQKRLKRKLTISNTFLQSWLFY